MEGDETSRGERKLRNLAGMLALGTFSASREVECLGVKVIGCAGHVTAMAAARCGRLLGFPAVCVLVGLSAFLGCVSWLSV